MLGLPEALLHYGTSKVANLLGHNPQGGDFPWVRSALTYEPRTEEGKAIVGAARKAEGVINAPGTWVTEHTKSPELGFLTNAALQTAPFIGAGALAKTAPEAAIPEAATEPPEGFDTEPVRGGVPQAAVGSRAAVLRRIGLETARESALTGDASSAATDYQLSKFNEPAGVAARSQFDTEKTALQNHASKIVDKTGGTLGMDEDSLNNRGQTIAAPFDALRKWFADQKAADYAAADAKAGGQPIGQMEGTQALLKDPDFTETLLAKDQGGLLGSVQRQFQRFQELNPNGFLVACGELPQVAEPGMDARQQCDAGQTEGRRGQRRPERRRGRYLRSCPSQGPARAQAPGRSQRGIEALRLRPPCADQPGDALREDPRHALAS
jgi:hypothetical protein